MKATLVLSTMFVTGIVYSRTTEFDLVDYDDPGYVSANPHVLGGPTAENLIWAFTTTAEGNWHPLTWISLQLNSRNADATPLSRDVKTSIDVLKINSDYHDTNTAIHVLTTGLLCLIFGAWTGLWWPASVTALLWGLHPLHVESVAWISERKDVLSGFFWVLAMAAYGRYAAAPTFWRMASVTLAMTIGLTAKPMLVTLPCALILLDYAPFGRLATRGDFFRRVVEKWPLWLLSVASACITLYAQDKGHAVRKLEEYTVRDRLEGTAMGYWVYLEKTFYPDDMAAFYPIPVRPWWQPFGAATIMATLSAGVIALRKRQPLLFTGWFWFLGTLVPVIGIVQVSTQAYADRYVYIPHIGLFFGLIYSLRNEAVRFGVPLVALLGLAILLQLELYSQTGKQIEVWKNSETLWTHALKCTEKNSVAFTNLAIQWRNSGREREKSLEYFREACRLDPKNVLYVENLANALEDDNLLDEAEKTAERGLQLSGNRPKLWVIFGMAARKRGNSDDAIARLRKALEIEDSAATHRELGTALTEAGRLNEAIGEFSIACDMEPQDAGYSADLAQVLIEVGRSEEVIPRLEAVRELPAWKLPVTRMRLVEAYCDTGRFEAARRIAPETVRDDPRILKHWISTAWTFSTRTDANLRDGRRAYRLILSALAATEPNPSAECRDAYAAVLAENGRFDEAVREAETAAAEAQRIGLMPLAEAIRGRAELYRRKQPFRMPSN